MVGGLRLGSSSSVDLDPDVVVVAPFDVLAPEPELTMWREGLVDLLSRSLDGAGPIRTVSPTAATRQWAGRADGASAVELGRKTGAGLAVFGSLVSTGDSARLVSTLLDVNSGRSLVEIELYDALARVDRLADSLSHRILRNLSRSRLIGSVRLHSLGSASPAAVKAFL